jgi:hypothetical protein
MKLHTLFAGALLAAFFTTAPRDAAAQVPVPDTVVVVADTIPQGFAVPRGALIRALVVPGWGHLYVGTPRRAAVFATLQGASWFMLGRTIHRHGTARDAERAAEAVARDSLATAMAADTALARQLADPFRFQQALDQNPGFASARALADSRGRHRQDWIVYTVAFTFAAAIDAYVAAHLAEFPADLTAAPGSDGGVSIGLRFSPGLRRH